MEMEEQRMKSKSAINKARQLMKEQNLDGLLVTDPYNIRYLSGFTGSTAVVVITNNGQYVITDFRYIEQAAMQCQDCQVMEIGKKSLLEIYNEIMAKDLGDRIGYEDLFMTVQQYHTYEKQGNQKELVPLDNQLNLLRVQKEPWELQRIARAEEIGDMAFTHILDFIKPGKTEMEIALELEFYMRSHGAEKLSFDTIVASGIHSSMPHAYPREKKIEHGDFVTMDFGCVYEGYCSDMTRTIVVGKADEQQKEIYQLVLQAQETALHMIHAGQIGRDVDRAARDVIAKAGYGEHFGHGLGHSVGLYIHEDPRYSTGCDKVVPENAVMSVEPGVYIPGWGGVRIEDLIVVKADGYENLTHSPKQLIEI